MRAERVIERSEAEFHDRWAAETDVARIEVDSLFESGSCPENQDILRWMGDPRGKRILEIGCGLGEASVYFAKRGAIVTAVDISEGMLELTQKLAARHGVRVETVHTSAGDLSAVPDERYDCVYAANLLHHVEIPAFLEQVERKLAPGGAAYFWDPILYNPIIQVYRKLATAVRTEDEHPLRVRDLKTIRERFGPVQVRFRWYLALGIFLKYFLIDRIHPSQSRYWKKVIEDAPTAGPLLGRIHALDRMLFAWIPGMRWLAWNIVIRAEKPHDQA